MTHTKLMFALDASLRKKFCTLTITPFRSLNPYQTMWTIKGCVTMKKEKYQFNSKNGNSHMFIFDIIDTERNEVRITCFNDVADLHFDKVQVGSVYTLYGGTIKSTNKFYNKLNNDFEITLTEDSTLSLCEDDLLIPTL